MRSSRVETFKVPADYWATPIEDLLATLDASPLGLSSSEARRRLRDRNTVARRDRSPGLALLGRQFRNPIVLLLVTAAIISTVFADVAEASITVAIVVLSGLLTFAQERGAVRAVEDLQRSIETRATVVRDGREHTVAATDVVAGDMVMLGAGSMIPADCRVMHANSLMVDESSLTGESFPKHKSPGQVAAHTPLAERANCLHFGTHVSSGSGTALAVRAGAETVYGALVAHARRQHLPTAFERGITRYGVLLVRATTVLVAGVFVANVVLGRQVVESLLFSLALAVGLTPQMLPAIVTLSLSTGTRLLARRRVVVTRLDAIEDFGGMTVLCTDKTGTLTTGSVSFVAGLDPSASRDPEVERLATWNALLQRGFSNPMDDAIRDSAVGKDAVATGLPVLEREIPFDFTRKILSVVVRTDAQRRVVTKGAVSSVLDRCRWVWMPSGAPRDAAICRSQIEQMSRRLASDGTRHLALATAELPVEPSRVGGTPAPGDGDVERDLTFRGFLVFDDPVKNDAADAIVRLEALGVRVMLVTGDSAASAGHIARDVGLREPDQLSGSDVDGLDDGDLGRRLTAVGACADVDPLQKERIVGALSRSGESVGFLGDGINDVAALHAADVGISVDAAVDAARQMADIVLLDKDLSVIAAGVEEGRKVFRNTLKYVHVTTSANFGNMVSLALTTLFLPFLPLLPLQVLLLNFLSDIPGMTIATDRVDSEQLRSPSHWDIGGLRKFMVVFGLISTAADLVTFWVLRGVHDLGAGGLRSGWFIESVLTELAALLCLRTARPLWRSRPGRWLWLTSLGVAVATFAAVYSPISGALGFEAVDSGVVTSLVVVAAAYIAVTEIVKARWPNLLGFVLSSDAEWVGLD